MSGRAPARWRRTAEADALRLPEERQGFILPCRSAQIRRRGRPARLVPDDPV